MSRQTMLNEHLQAIHVIHEFDIAGMKSKIKNIGPIAASGNILKLNRALATMKDVPLSQINSLARKKFPSEFKQASKDVDKKLKKSPSKIKESLASIKASLLKAKNITKDPEVQAKIQKALVSFDKLLTKLEKKGVKADEGLGMIYLGLIVAFALGDIFALGSFLVIGGMATIAGAIIIQITKELISLYIDNKKKGNRTVKI